MLQCRVRLALMRPFLKEWRDFKGMSQEAVGGALGKSDATIARWESGERQAGIDDLIKLAELYRCRPQDLWSPPDEPVGAPLDVSLLQRVVTMAARKIAGMAGPFKPEDFVTAILNGYEAGSAEVTRERQREAIERELKGFVVGQRDRGGRRPAEKKATATAV